METPETPCTIHPDRPAVEGTDPLVCLACMLGAGPVDAPSGPDPFQGFVGLLMSSGAPCKCGPGFCASSADLGYYGFCNGSRKVGAPDCPICCAQHQSDAGCWNCSRAGGALSEGERCKVLADTYLQAVGLSWDPYKDPDGGKHYLDTHRFVCAAEAKDNGAVALAIQYAREATPETWKGRPLDPLREVAPYSWEPDNA